MRVTREQRASLRQRRRPIRRVACQMAMAEMQQVPVGPYLGKIAQAGEIEHHLVHFRVAIAPNGYDALGNAVKGGEHFFGRIAFGQVVARAVIEQVAEQEHAVGRFPVDALHQSADGGRRAMQVGCDDELHWSFLSIDGKSAQYPRAKMCFSLLGNR